MPRDLSDDDFDLPLGTTRKRPPTSTSPNPRSSHKRLSKGNAGSGSSPTGTRGEGVLPVTPAASPRFEESRRISASKNEGARRKVVTSNSTRGGVSSDAGRGEREGESRRRADERLEEEGPVASTSAGTSHTPARKSVTNSTRRSSGKEVGRKDESGKKQRRNSTAVVMDDVDESGWNEVEEDRDRKPRINHTTRSSPLPTQVRKSPTKSPKKRVLPPSPSTSHDPSPPVIIIPPLPLPPPVTPIDDPSLPSVQAFLSALPLPLSHLYPTFEVMGCITGVDLLALADDSEVGKGSRKLLLDLVGEENQEGMSRWQRVMLEEGLKSVKKRWFQ